MVDLGGGGKWSSFNPNLPQKKQVPLNLFPPEFRQLFSSHLYFFFKKKPLHLKKAGGYRNYGS